MSIIEVLNPITVQFTDRLLKGDKGDKGDQGIQGIQGEQGIQGIQGIPGDQLLNVYANNLGIAWDSEQAPVGSGTTHVIVNPFINPVRDATEYDDTLSRLTATMAGCYLIEYCFITWTTNLAGLYPEYELFNLNEALYISKNGSTTACLQLIKNGNDYIPEIPPILDPETGGIITPGVPAIPATPYNGMALVELDIDDYVDLRVAIPQNPWFPHNIRISGPETSTFIRFILL